MGHGYVVEGCEIFQQACMYVHTYMAVIHARVCVPFERMACLYVTKNQSIGADSWNPMIHARRVACQAIA